MKGVKLLGSCVQLAANSESLCVKHLIVSVFYSRSVHV